MSLKQADKAALIQLVNQFALAPFDLKFEQLTDTRLRMWFTCDCGRRNHVDVHPDYALAEWQDAGGILADAVCPQCDLSEYENPGGSRDGEENSQEEDLKEKSIQEKSN